jgi:hypothetical protein
MKSRCPGAVSVVVAHLVGGTMQSPSAVLPPNPTAQRLRREIWPAAAITFGLILTVGWVCLLGSGVLKLVQLAI